MVDGEIDSVREAMKFKTCASCTCMRGCRMCCPPITFIVCQSQRSSRRIVPYEEKDIGNRGVNVCR